MPHSCTKIKLHEYLQAVQPLATVQCIKNPNNYSNFKEMVFHKELREELTVLKALSKDLKAFPNKFKEQCKKRALRNQNSCLSFMCAPESPCNQLYWDLAKLVFQPNSLSEMLSIILPQAQYYLDWEFMIQPDVLSTKKSKRSLKLRFELIKLTDLKEDLGAVSSLNHFILANEILLRVSDVALFTIPVHQQFYQELMKVYPDLGTQLYQHNNQLKSLLSQLKFLSTQGQSPREVLTHLVQQLNEGGERNKGKEFASLEAQAAYLNCKEYLNALPPEMKKSVYSLTNDNDESLRNILDDTHNCVETAAYDLDTLLNKPANADILAKAPNITLEERSKLIAQYNLNLRNNFCSQRKNDSAEIPDYWLKKLLSRIKLEDDDDYLSFVLSLSPKNYPFFLQQVVFGLGLQLSEELAERIAEGVVSAGQLTAFNHAIVDVVLLPNRFKLPKKKWFTALFIDRASRMENVLAFAIIGNNPELIDLAHNKYPLEIGNALHDIIDKNLSVLASSFSKPILFRALLQALPKANRLSILGKKYTGGQSIIFLAGLAHEENLRTVFSVLSNHNPLLYRDYQHLVKRYNKLPDKDKSLYLGRLREKTEENFSPSNQFFLSPKSDNAKLPVKLFLLIKEDELQELALNVCPSTSR